MTSASPLPLESLAQHIARQQSELESLQQEYQSRQSRLSDLHRQKEEIENQLRELDVQIEAVSRGAAPAPAPAAKPKPVQPTAAVMSVQPRAGMKLADFLVDLVPQSHQPLTVKQLAHEVARQKYPTTSNNIPRMIQTRVYELVNTGAFQRSKDHSGFVLGKGAGKATTPPAAPSAKKTGKAPVKPKSSRGSEKNGSEKVFLRPLLTELLKKSSRPLKARELAELAVANGYITESMNLTNVVWVMLGRMDNVENVLGEGYR